MSEILKKIRNPVIASIIILCFIGNLILFPLGLSTALTPSHSFFWGIVYEYTGFRLHEAFLYINYPVLNLMIPIAEDLGLPKFFVVIFFLIYWLFLGYFLGVLAGISKKKIAHLVTFKRKYSDKHDIEGDKK